MHLQVALEDEWAARADARADTYRLAAEVEALEAEVAAEKARADAAQQVCVVYHTFSLSIGDDKNI